MVVILGYSIIYDTVLEFIQNEYTFRLHFHMYVFHEDVTEVLCNLKGFVLF